MSKTGLIKVWTLPYLWNDEKYKISDSISKRKWRHRSFKLCSEYSSYFEIWRTKYQSEIFLIERVLCCILIKIFMLLEIDSSNQTFHICNCLKSYKCQKLTNSHFAKFFSVVKWAVKSTSTGMTIMLAGRIRWKRLLGARIILYCSLWYICIVEPIWFDRVPNCLPVNIAVSISTLVPKDDSFHSNYHLVSWDAPYY